MERYRQMRNRVKQKEENVQNTKLYSEKKKTANDLKENDMPTGKGFGGTNDKFRSNRNADNEEDNDNQYSYNKSGRFGGGSRGGRGRGRGRPLSDSHGSRSFTNRHHSEEADSNAFNNNFNHSNVTTENEHYHNEIFASIPKDFKRDTVLEFMEKLPEILKSSNLLQRYLMYSYILKAYEMNLDEAKRARPTFSKSATENKRSHLEKHHMLRNIINVEEEQEEFLNWILDENMSEDSIDIIDIYQQKGDSPEMITIQEEEQEGIFNLPKAEPPLLNITDIISEHDVALPEDTQQCGFFSSLTVPCDDHRSIWPRRRPRIINEEEYRLCFPLPKRKILKIKCLRPHNKKSIATRVSLDWLIENEFNVEDAFNQSVVVDDNRQSIELSEVVQPRTDSSSIPIVRQLPSPHLIGSSSLKLPATIKDSHQILTSVEQGEQMQNIDSSSSMNEAARYYPSKTASVLGSQLQVESIIVPPQIMSSQSNVDQSDGIISITPGLTSTTLPAQTSSGERRFYKGLLNRNVDRPAVSTPLGVLDEECLSKRRHTTLTELNSLEEAEEQLCQSNKTPEEIVSATGETQAHEQNLESIERVVQPRPEQLDNLQPLWPGDYRKDWYEILRTRTEGVGYEQVPTIYRAKKRKRKRARVAPAQVSENVIRPSQGPQHILTDILPLPGQDVLPPLNQSLELSANRERNDLLAIGDDLVPQLNTAQQQYDQFIKENYENISIVMNNLDIVRAIFDSYRRCQRGVDIQKSVMHYDAELVLNACKRRLSVKRDIIRALICNRSFDFTKLDCITDKMAAAIGFAFVLELKAVGLINLAANGRIIHLI
ncbi:ATP-dependent RNA helicase vasa isoform 1-T1 [Glossina fuscipes fuscipes]